LVTTALINCVGTTDVLGDVFIVKPHGIKPVLEYELQSGSVDGHVTLEETT